MSKPEHTPGPWFLNRSGAGMSYLVGPPQWAGAIEREADANLIAAAPDLLEALQGLVDECTVATDSENFAFGFAQDTIDKALGEQP